MADIFKKYYSIITIFWLAIASMIYASGPMEDGESYYLKGKYGSAVSSYKKALTYDLNKNNRANCWYMLGQCYLMIGDFKDARIAFFRITKDYSKTEWLADAYIGIGDTYYHEKKYDSALKYYKLSMSAKYLSQHGSSIYYRLAKTNRSLKNTSRASYYEKIIRDKYPDSLEARLLLTGNNDRAFTSAKPIKKYTVQVAFSTRADFAKDCADKFKKKGYNAYVDVVSSKGKTRFRILVGRYQGREPAENLMNKIRKKENVKAFVTTISDD